MKKYLLILALSNFYSIVAQTLTPHPILCTYIAPSDFNGNFSGVINASNCIQDHQNSTNSINILGNQEVQLKAGKEILLDGEVNIQPDINGDFYAHISRDFYEVAWFDPFSSLGSVPLHEKLELGIKVPNSINEAISNYILENGQTPSLNPFNPNQISVKAFFIQGDDTVKYYYLGQPFYVGETKTVYGFYYKEFERVTPQPEATLVNTWHWNGNINMVDQVNTEYNFRVRFAPKNLGIHHCLLSISINNQPYEQIGSISFNVVNSNSHGFVKVSNDKRFFERDNNFYFPAGRNLPGPSCWHNIDQGLDPYGCHAIGLNCAAIEGWCISKNPKFQMTYENQLSNLSNGGCHFFRYVNFEDKMEIEFEKLNNYYDRLDNAWEIDRLLDHCKNIDMSMIFVLQHHASISTHDNLGRFKYDFSAADKSQGTGVGVYPQVHNCYDEDNGYAYNQISGVNSVKDFLQNTEAKENYKHRLRYYISRYGYSNKIAMFELMSEINNLGHYFDSITSNIDPNGSGGVFTYCTDFKSSQYIYPGENSNDPEAENANYDSEIPGLIYQWQNEMICYIKQELQCNQILGTSYAGYPKEAIEGKIWNDTRDVIKDTFDPDLTYFSGCVDYVSWNNYSLNSVRYANTSDAIHGRFGGSESYKNIPAYNKPFIHSEWGQYYAEGCDKDIEFYKGLWKGSFMGIAAVPLEWGSQHNKDYLFNAYNVFNDFIAGVDLRNTWIQDFVKPNPLEEMLYYRNANNNASKAIGVIDNLTVNMYSIATGSACLNGIVETTQQTPIQVNSNLLKLQNMGVFQEYYIDYYHIKTGAKLYTVGPHFTNLIGDLITFHPTLFDNEDLFMYAFKAYRVNDGAFLIAQNPPIAQKEHERTIDVEINNLSLIDVKSGFNTKYVDVISNTIFTNLSLYSIDGKFIGNYSLENNGVEIDFSSITKGVYIVVAQNEIGELLTTKIIW